MDLLVLADRDEIVDKTHEAIARITNVPIEDIRRAITQLESPDPNSRSELEEGRRMRRLDEHRDWGWQIVNYEAYRNIRDEEARKAYFREKKREQRAKILAESQSVQNCQNKSNGVLDSPTMSTNAYVSDSFSLSSAGEDSKGEGKKNAAQPENYEALKNYLM